MTPPVEIKQQRRKSLMMRVKPDGSIIVCIPHWMKADHPQVERFVEEGLRKLDSHIPATRPEQTHSADSVRALVRTYADLMGLKPGRVQLREMTRKWGSCSTKGSITLNTALFYVPHHLVEYIVVHELAHMVHFDHSADFWKLVATYIPDYAARERELDTYRV